MEEFNRKQKMLGYLTFFAFFGMPGLGIFLIVEGDDSTAPLAIGMIVFGILAGCIGLIVKIYRDTYLYRVCKKAGVTGKTKDADIAIIKAKCNEMGVEEKDAIDFYEQSEFTATSIGFSPKRFAFFILLFGILSIVVSCTINGGDSGSGGNVCPSCGRTVSRLYGGMCKTCHDNFEWGMSALGR